MLDLRPAVPCTRAMVPDQKSVIIASKFTESLRGKKICLLVKYKPEKLKDQSVDQKSRFGWGFLEHVQTEFISNHDQNLQTCGVCSDPGGVTHHQSIPKPNPHTRT